MRSSVAMSILFAILFALSHSQVIFWSEPMISSSLPSDWTSTDINEWSYIPSGGTGLCPIGTSYCWEFSTASITATTLHPIITTQHGKIELSYNVRVDTSSGSTGSCNVEYTEYFRDGTTNNINIGSYSTNTDTTNTFREWDPSTINHNISFTISTLSYHKNINCYFNEFSLSGEPHVTSSSSTSSPPTAPTITTISPTDTTTSPTIITTAPTTNSVSPTEITSFPTLNTPTPSTNTISPTMTTSAPTDSTSDPTTFTSTPTVTSSSPSSNTLNTVSPTVSSTTLSRTTSNIPVVESSAALETTASDDDIQVTISITLHDCGNNEQQTCNVSSDAINDILIAYLDADELQITSIDIIRNQIYVLLVAKDWNVLDKDVIANGIQNELEVKYGDVDVIIEVKSGMHANTKDSSANTDLYTLLIVGLGAIIVVLCCGGLLYYYLDTKRHKQATFRESVSIMTQITAGVTRQSIVVEPGSNAIAHRNTKDVTETAAETKTTQDDLAEDDEKSRKETIINSNPEGQTTDYCETHVMSGRQCTTLGLIELTSTVGAKVGAQCVNEKDSDSGDSDDMFVEEELESSSDGKEIAHVENPAEKTEDERTKGDFYNEYNEKVHQDSKKKHYYEEYHEKDHREVMEQKEIRGKELSDNSNIADDEFIINGDKEIATKGGETRR